MSHLLPGGADCPACTTYGEPGEQRPSCSAPAVIVGATVEGYGGSAEPYFFASLDGEMFVSVTRRPQDGDGETVAGLIRGKTVEEFDAEIEERGFTPAGYTRQEGRVRPVLFSREFISGGDVTIEFSEAAA